MIKKRIKDFLVPAILFCGVLIAFQGAKMLFDASYREAITKAIGL